METREQSLIIEQHDRRFNEVLGDPGTMVGVRNEAEAAIRMKTADWVTIEQVVDPEQAEAQFKQKLASIQEELHHYVESLEMAKEKGVEGVVIPDLEFSDEFAEKLIEIARDDPRTQARVEAQMNALDLSAPEVSPDTTDEFDIETHFVDPIESKDDIYAYDLLHTAKQRILKLGHQAAKLLVKL